uniref:Protein crumbs n=1 Tax=Phallusia mammillata TaxID=59560 RepID=A0A6F9DA53_9ASCI|nr:protein crumbs [Phallusia mammillata]
MFHGDPTGLTIQSHNFVWGCPLNDHFTCSLNPCDSNPCLNDGSCHATEKKFTCLCQKRYNGTHCEKDLGQLCDLTSSKCMNNGTCVEVGSGSETICNCSPGFYDNKCNNSGINPCLSNPCHNKGSCASKENGEFVCYCISGFTGIQCEADINECLSSPCQNGGTCEEFINEYRCLCNGTGFTGPLCSQDINECTKSPCPEQSTCYNRPGDFVCLCPVGYSGRYCDKEIDECLSNPCMHGGTCVDLIGSFGCQCHVGYTGYFCEEEINYCLKHDCNIQTQDCKSEPGRYFCVCKKGFAGFNCSEINECSSNPCRNGATCVDEINRYLCECVPGYKGLTCAIEVDECDPNPCRNNARCNDLINSYICSCTVGWTGQNCTEIHAPCDEKPCHNGAPCRTLLDTNRPGYDCRCLPGFQGYNCDVNIDDCVNVTCGYNEICIDQVETYNCSCLAGFARDRVGNCTVEIDECSSNPCKHNSTCVDLIDGYTCNCTHGYEGQNCDVETDFCVSQPCQNDGICQRRLGSYTCFCATGFLGLQCEYKHNPCESDPCLYGSTCHVVDGGLYRCECSDGYKGPNCEIDIDDCATNPCLHGNCTDLVADYLCACAVGWEGNDCDVDIDECLSAPCQNNSTCQDKVAGYECLCQPGYTGAHCTIDINECENKPCLNNGTCVDGVNSFQCICNHTGYYGNLCDVEVNECELVTPCLNGATCDDLVNDYFCKCLPAYRGRNCEVDIPDCASQPCRHNSTCVERSDVSKYGSVFDGNFTHENADGYQCLCTAGYEGTNCEIEIDECISWRPCKFGSVCVDHIADYECLCENGFGGRNCTVKLTGCEEHQCANNAVCQPYLVDEYTDTHSYTCRCGAGFTSFFCNTSTSVSFNDAQSHVTFSIPLIDQTHHVTFDFRTVLTNGVLLSTKIGTENFTVGLENGFLRTVVTNAVTNHSTTRVLTTQMVDGDWWKLSFVLSNSHITVKAGNQNASIPLANSLSELEDIQLGGDGFVGCIRDFTLDDQKRALNNATSLQNVSQGCAREQVCFPTTCNAKGRCVDLWTHQRCDCDRPHKGPNCESTIQPFTFSHMQTSSAATFKLPSAPRRTFNVSMFIKTRQENTFLLSTTDNITSVYSATNVTAVVMEIDGGKLKTTTGGQSFIAEPALSDGKSHFVSVQIAGDQIWSSIDDKSIFEETLPTRLDIQSPNIYVGGIIDSSAGVRRRRRSVSSNSTSFKGTIQDLRLNKHKLIFSAPESNESNIEALSYVVAVTENVLPGEVSDPVCGSPDNSEYTNPCQNNGTCDVTFNDYVCNCTHEWRGRNCGEPIFCRQLQCPEGLTCVDLSNGGFECRAPSTFNTSSMISYQITNNFTLNITRVSFKIRTRSVNASVCYLPTESGTIRFKLVSDGRLRISYNGDHVDSMEPINDGLWHDVVFSSNNSLQIDGAKSGSIVSNFLIGQIVSRDTARILIGATELSASFKGCLDDVRINDFLLPYYNQTSLTNHMAAEVSTPFTMTSPSTNVIFGCLGDDVCSSDPCKNDGTCVDEFNVYKCTCRQGFTTKNCDVNIDDCVNVTCSGQGKCMDAINGYVCECFKGYKGHLCETDVDECAPSPCLNGGTCYNLIGSYRCDCNGTNFIGDRCQLDTSQACGDLTHKNHPCVNSGKCRNITEGDKVSFLCSCNLPFTGRKCDVEMDPCENNSCENNSTCIANKTVMSHQCACAQGYTGVTCQTWIGQCSSSPCQNNGSCHDNGSGHQCTCIKGFIGVTCEYNNLCLSKRSASLCANNGKCQVELDREGMPAYSCKCTEQHAGATCEFPNPCLNYTCNNGGICNVVTQPVTSGGEMHPKAVCQCMSGYSGEFCDSDLFLFSSSGMIVLIAAVGGAGLLLLLILGAVATVSAALERRATSGTYSPSKQETSSAPPGLGGRLESEVWTELKPPPPCERLI